jgi:surface protein
MKNYVLLTLFAFMAISCSSDDSSDEESCTECIKCQEMEVGETFTKNGVTYTVVDNESLRQAVKEGWDMKTVCTSHVTEMNELFFRRQFNGDISNWDVSNVTSMAGMFRGSSFNGDISNWDVSNVTSMFDMFYESPFSGDISKWDVSNVESCIGFSPRRYGDHNPKFKKCDCDCR